MSPTSFRLTRRMRVGDMRHHLHDNVCSSRKILRLYYASCPHISTSFRKTLRRFHHPSHRRHHRLALHQGKTKQLLAQVFERGTKRVKACTVKQQETVVDGRDFAHIVCFPILGSGFHFGNN